MDVWERIQGEFGNHDNISETIWKHTQAQNRKETRREHVSVLEAVGTALASPPQVIGPHTATRVLFAGV